MEPRHRAEADVCFSKQRAQSEDGDGDFMGMRGQQACANKRKPMFALANSGYERNLRWWEERNVEARSKATLRVNERWRAKESLSTTYYHLPMHCTLRYGT